MKVVIAGRGWLAVRGAQHFALLTKLTRPDAEIICVPTPPPDDRLPALRQVAESNGWPCYREFREIDLGPADLVLSLQHPDIIRLPDLGGARAVNLHFSPLPRHRGSLSCYWPIVGRDRTTGVTLHELAARVDAGPVIATRYFALPEHTNAGQLSALFHEHGFELLAAEAESLLAGTYLARPQPADGVRAHRRSDVDFGRAELTDFDRPVLQVRAECLALVFPGFQLPTFQGRRVRDAHVLRVAAGPLAGLPGEVVAETKETAVLRCADGYLVLEFDTP
ncbi:formyltransferase family protein [Crossiella equi]|nr:formyltransferase family protein [Crossiella equi]